MLAYNNSYIIYSLCNEAMGCRHHPSFVDDHSAAFDLTDASVCQSYHHRKLVDPCLLAANYTILKFIIIKNNSTNCKL